MSQADAQAEIASPATGAPRPQDVPIVQEPARLGPIQRLIGTLFSPGETFEDVNRKPTWMVPALISVVSSIAFMWFLLFHFETGWREFMKKAMASRSGAAAPTGQDLEMAFMITKWSYLIFAGVGVVIFILATAGIFALGMMLLQAKTTFKKVLAVVTWCWAATGLLQVIVTIASVLVRGGDTSSFNPQEMGSLSAANLGAFLPDGTSAFVKGLASTIDVFSIWFLILLTIGLAAVAGSRKIKSSSVAPLVLGLWIVSALIRAGLAAAFGG
ncbi:MAG: YIP1 family protein [Blastocatellia bacterium]